jgi:16S rRNA processing protein RimM
VPADDALVPVGRVGRPHGTDGAFVVEHASEEESRFAVGARLWVGGEQAEVVVSRRVGGGRRAIRLDRPVARGRELAVRRSDLPEPEEGSYYVFQLVGLPVEESGGRSLGRVEDVEPGVANDTLVVEGGVLLPLVEDCVLDVDLEAGRIVVATGFADPDGS